MRKTNTRDVTGSSRRRRATESRNIRLAACLLLGPSACGSHSGVSLFPAHLALDANRCPSLTGSACRCSYRGLLGFTLLLFRKFLGPDVAQHLLPGRCLGGSFLSLTLEDTRALARRHRTSKKGPHKKPPNSRGGC
jgi:hypothetical protein